MRWAHLQILGIDALDDLADVNDIGRLSEHDFDRPANLIFQEFNVALIDNKTCLHQFRIADLAELSACHQPCPDILWVKRRPSPGWQVGSLVRLLINEWGWQHGA